MKKTIIMLAAMVLLAAPALADYSGGQVYYDRFSGYYAGNGGEFTIRTDGGVGLLLSNSAYDAKARGIKGYTESFQTFCVEGGEYVAQPMKITVSTTFVDESTGAVTGSGSHAVKGGLTYGDNLNPQTAYLYYQFAKGVLSNYNYTAGANRNASAGSLQNAIWYLEGESSSLNAQAKLWVQDAVNATGVAYQTYSPTGTPTWGNTIGDVRVLNMYTLSNGLAQDQLYVIPAPAAIGLGMIGLGLVGWLMRRLA